MSLCHWSCICWTTCWQSCNPQVCTFHHLLRCSKNYWKIKSSVKNSAKEYKKWVVTFNCRTNFHPLTLLTPVSLMKCSKLSFIKCTGLFLSLKKLLVDQKYWKKLQICSRVWSTHSLDIRFKFQKLLSCWNQTLMNTSS